MKKGHLAPKHPLPMRITEEINIQLALGIKYIAKRIGPRAAEEKNWKEIMEKARNCSECGECLKRCPFQLPIPDLIKENIAWYDRLRAQ